VINGNSGGGIWRKSDKMLMGLANYGEHQLGQSGWDNSSAESGNHNSGPAMWAIYANSRTLKDVFPGGRNRYAANDGGSDLYVAIGEDEGADDFQLYVSAPSVAAKVILC